MRFEFDPSVVDKIGYYVYALVDPRDQKPFYVGKGIANRVFNHAAEAIESTNASDKLNLIREIRSAGHEVKHVILRHGLDEKTALTVEASILDFSLYFNLELKNLVQGHHSSAFGAMAADEVQRKYVAPPLESLGDDCVIININREYKRAKQTKSFYEVTREYWAMADPRERNLRYVLSEYQSFIVEVFEVEEWYPANEGKRTRWGFRGKIAADEIRDRYFNRKIHKARGTANPISYRLQAPADTST
jgi:hypothetical protein